MTKDEALSAKHEGATTVALKLALEALEQWNTPLYKRGKAITAIREALQRKPLTDEEIFDCENSIPDEAVTDRDWCIHFARAIEAAHGIKE